MGLSWNLNNTIHVKYEKEFQILNEKFKLNEQKINNLYNVIIGNELLMMNYLKTILILIKKELLVKNYLLKIMVEKL